MATSMRDSPGRQMCGMCAPKQVTAAISCEGCLKKMCRKHFNEHRDVLSKDLQNVFDLHDTLLEELQLKIDRGSKPTDNNEARAILSQINEWEATIKMRASEAAHRARADVQRLFDWKSEFDQLKQKVDKITLELKEQQESESFVETDIDDWIKQLEQLKIDLNRPSEAETNPPILQIGNIEWNTIIKITFPSKSFTTNSTDFVQPSTKNNQTSVASHPPPQWYQLPPPVSDDEDDELFR